MALIDSEAAFGQRLAEVVTDANARQSVLAGGIRSFSMLAFASGTPQNPHQMRPLERLQMAFCQ